MRGERLGDGRSSLFAMIQRCIRDMAAASTDVSESRQVNSTIDLRGRASLRLEWDDTHREGRPDLSGWSVASTSHGLSGLFGPLPPYVATALRADERAGVSILRDLLAVFENRHLWFLYRAWLISQPCRLVEARRVDPSFGTEIGRKLVHGAYLGLGEAVTNDLPSCTLEWMLGGLPILIRRRVSAGVVEEVLSRALRCSVRVEQFVPIVLEMNEESVSRIGKTASHLGADMMLGRRTVDHQSAMRLVIGPLDWHSFAKLQDLGSSEPGSDSTVAGIRRLLGRLAEGSMEIRVQLILRKEDIPEAKLGGASPSLPLDQRDGRLGRSVWARAAKPRHDFVAPDFPVAVERDFTPVGLGTTGFSNAVKTKSP